MVKVKVIECKHHGFVEHAFYDRWRCKICTKERRQRYRKSAKENLLNKFGNACSICGYNKYIGALEFHHIDPSTKEFGLASTGWMAGNGKLEKEAEKCIVLCSNCHKEVEGGIVVLGDRLAGMALDSDSRIR